MKVLALIGIITFTSIIFLLSTGTSHALLDNEWDATTCILSYSNPVIDKDGYTIKLEDFDGYGAVNINIYQDGTVIGSTVLINNETAWSCIDEDNIEIRGLRITDRNKFPIFGNWPDDPKAEITIRIKKVQTSAKISVKIDVDDKEYILDERVTANIIVKNVGETKTNNILLRVSADGLNIVDKKEYKYVSIEDGSSKSENIEFRFAQALSDNISIFANVTWDDGRQNIEERENISIKTPLKITKFTTGNGNQNSTFYTTIGITNVQTRTIHAVLSDVLPLGFSFIDSSVKDDKRYVMWEFDIGPGEKKTFSYKSVTKFPAVYDVPTPRLKYNLGGQEYLTEPEYSTTITVLQSQAYIGNIPNLKSKKTPTEMPTEIPTETTSKGGPEVNLAVTVLATVSLDVTPESISFGTLAPGKTSPKQMITLINEGTNNATITVEVADNASNLFIDGIVLNKLSWDQFSTVLDRKSECSVSTVLSVPSTYTGFGDKKGILIFWAESCK